jgi:hypothetical protein
VISIFAHHVYVQLAAVEVTFVTVGLIVSIPVTVTRISLVVSQSASLNVPVSIPDLPRLGTYVPVFQFITKVHLAH